MLVYEREGKKHEGGLAPAILRDYEARTGMNALTIILATVRNAVLPSHVTNNVCRFGRWRICLPFSATFRLYQPYRLKTYDRFTHPHSNIVRDTR